MKIRGAYRISQKYKKIRHLGVILMYHRVVRLKHDPWKIAVSPENFAEHMNVLKKFTKIVQMGDLAKKLSGVCLGRKKAVVTFDDGYADNFYNARPILLEQGIPATFFITSGAIDSREEFWWDELDRFILSASDLPKIFDLSIKGHQYTWPLKAVSEPDANNDIASDVPKNHTPLSRLQLYYGLWQVLSHLSYQDKKAALKDIMAWAGVRSEARPEYRAMTSKELKELSSSPLFEIGAHTVRHPMLSRLSSKDQEAEINYSREDVEKMTGRTITSFAYPHGEFTAETVSILKRLKFNAACTVAQNPVVRNNNPFYLPRFTVLDWSGKEFEHHLQEWITKV